MQFSLLMLLLCFCHQAIAQTSFSDTVSVVTYNVNNYGYPSTSSCPLKGSPLRHQYLRTVMDYLNPDIVAFEKMNGTPATFSIDTIQKKVLDSVCAGCYAAAAFTNVSGYQKVNSLFYKTAKFGYLGTTSIFTADNNISDINLHKLYYKSPDLSTTNDTIFLSVIVAHISSGSGSASDRATQIGGAANWLKAHTTTPSNYIFLGDFNTQSSTESCYQKLVNAADTNTRFYDPPNQPGNWSANGAAFAKYLTQSTRTSDPGDCAATGGINDRFDHILCTNPIMNGTKQVKYIPNSFTVVGQDGLHTNKAINASPANTSVPTNVLNALYLMSEHLPVALKLAISNNGSILPLQTFHLTVSFVRNSNVLHWQTINNDEVMSWEIEKSKDGIRYSVIHTVLQSEVSLSFADVNTYSATPVFYSIKKILRNGTFTYSNVVMVNLREQEVIQVIPNPVHSNASVILFSPETGTGKMYVTNCTRQVVMQMNVMLQRGMNTLNIPRIGALSKGIYVLQVTTAGYVWVEKVVKE